MPAAAQGNGAEGAFQQPQQPNQAQPPPQQGGEGTDAVAQQAAQLQALLRSCSTSRWPPASRCRSGPYNPVLITHAAVKRW